MITTLCIAGGGAKGMMYYAILREAHHAGLWNRENLKHIFATSVGAIIGCIVTLCDDWQVIDEYIVRRPWNKVFKMDLSNVVDAIETKGILNQKPIIDILEPLFLAKDIPIDVTLKDWYDITGVDLHFYTTRIQHHPETVELSRTTHPSWRVLDAVYASAALPVLFQPHQCDGQIYGDGAILPMDYPIKPCVDYIGDPNNVLGVATQAHTTELRDKLDYNLFDYLLFLISSRFEYKPESVQAGIEIRVPKKVYTNHLWGIYKWANEEKERVALMEEGVSVFREFQVGKGNVVPPSTPSL